MTDLVALVETMRKVQAELNLYDGPLAHYHGAWGDLHSAMKLTLAEHYRTHEQNAETAKLSAKRVIDKVYENGEDIAYNMRLLATGEIHPCMCEHIAHDPSTFNWDAHDYLKAPSGARQVPSVGYVCDECADGHMAPFLTSKQDDTSED